ncbi:MAG: hypothetical protein M1813_004704 [Trichoglossum hirsutum]|nr:MAG: hypothetical protein M1813_004704 [Trichoglossum hirsutum]
MSFSFTWILAILMIVWTLTILMVARSYSVNLGLPWKHSFSWYPANLTDLGSRWGPKIAAFNLTGLASPNIVSFYVEPESNDGSQTKFFLAILFVCTVQCPLTIGLHCVELLVNMSRDEAMWKAAGNTLRWSKGAQPLGAKISSRPIIAAVSSWQNIVLLILKALLHWLLGQSLMPSFSVYPTVINGIPNSYYGAANGAQFRLDIMYSRLLICIFVVIFLAAFATFLAFRKPKGPQPAAWGHIQTLAYLIDDWQIGKDDRLLWGDKGVGVNGIRHAGTSQNRGELGVINMNALYTGKEK